MLDSVLGNCKSVNVSRRVASVLAALAAAPMVVYAGTPHTEPASISPSTGHIDQSLRLESIGFRLVQANAAQCDHPQMLTGLMLNNIGGYAAVDRPAVSEVYNLTYGFGVLHVVPGSGADLAGLAEGDEIIAVNGHDLSSFAPELIRAAASFDRTERFFDYLEAALHAGPARLEIRRTSGRASVEISGSQGCGGRFAMLQRSSSNAWSDGRYVAVTDRMMDAVTDDHELAFVVAHEIAHNILHHANRSSSIKRLFMQFGIGAAKMKASEMEADTLAVELIARAGYDLNAPERLLRRSSRARWMDLPITHPGISRRILIVRAAIARLAIAQPQEQPLVSTSRSSATAWTEGAIPAAAPASRQ